MNANLPIPQMFDDPREISSIWLDDEHGLHVGRNGITRIVCYREPGEHAFIPFFAVFKGDHLFARQSGIRATVYYKEPTT